jgi:hypothetical protein
MILIMISNNEYNDSYSGINTDICYPFIYSIVNSTDSLAPAASAQTEGDCPIITNSQDHNCQNSDYGAFGPCSGNPPVPSCNGSHSQMQT